MLNLQFKTLFRRSIKTRVTLFTLTIFVVSIWGLSFYADSVMRENLRVPPANPHELGTTFR